MISEERILTIVDGVWNEGLRALNEGAPPLNGLLGVINGLGSKLFDSRDGRLYVHGHSATGLSVLSCARPKSGEDRTILGAHQSPSGVLVEYHSYTQAGHSQHRCRAIRIRPDQVVSETETHVANPDQLMHRIHTVRPRLIAALAVTAAAMKRLLSAEPCSDPFVHGYGQATLRTAHGFADPSETFMTTELRLAAHGALYDTEAETDTSEQAS